MDVFRRLKGLRDPDRTERRRQRRIKKTLRWGYLADPGTSSARRDATDPHRLAAFWALALGYIAEPGYDFEGGASIVDPEGVGPAIGFLQVPEAKVAKNRFHIDIRVAGEGPVDPAQHEQWVRAKSSELAATAEACARCCVPHADR